MRIINARLGFANNSSSSHSMIIVPREDYVKMSSSSSGDGYNWDNFTLADSESKLDYLATAVCQQLGSQGDHMSAIVVTREILGMPEWMPSGLIDHQSTFALPAGSSGEVVDVGFARAMASWIQSEGVVVLGGNDNSDGHPLSNETDAMPFGREAPNPYVAKYDDLSGSWTLFNRSNGAKVRLAFNASEALELQSVTPTKKSKATAADTEGGEPPKMGSPELVDVKITDYCDIGCAYCYQGSTVEGQHADVDDVRMIARRLFKGGTLEVAIGGGEPTRHPNFVEILEAFSAQGIVANFTTRDLSFLKNKPHAKRILAASKSIAVSVNSVAGIQAAQEAWKAYSGESYSSPMTFQYVIGTASDEELRKIVALVAKEKINVTLLGYKDSGRGAAWRSGDGKTFLMREAKVQEQSGQWMDLVQKALGDKSYARICIDTALARECEEQLGKKDIPRHLWHKSEGLVSMYVDAVSMTMGKSSYEPAHAMEPFDNDWLSRFAGWTPTRDEPARTKKKAPK